MKTYALRPTILAAGVICAVAFGTITARASGVGPAPSPAAATPTPAPHADATAASPADLEHAAFEQARPVFARYCDGCHSEQGAHRDREALRDLVTTRYPFAGRRAAVAGHAVAVSLGRGHRATMPDDHPGSVRGDDLARVMAWADAFDRAHATARTPSHR
jgi:uncharacterized membrane protein